MNSHGPGPQFSGLRVYPQLDSETALLPVGADQGLRCDPWTATATRHPGRCPGPPPRFRDCGARKRAAFGYYLRGMGVHAARRIPKILDLVMEPDAVSHMIKLEDYAERTRTLVSEVHRKIG